jgi:hypothetical protein
MWNLILVRLEIVLICTQDRCKVCTEHTIGLEIVLHAPVETPRWHGSWESHFGLFGDSVSVGAR